MELTPPVSRYEQLADILRQRIFGGTFPEDASGPSLGREYGVSQPVVQRAFEVLDREGLVRLESGRRTAELPRKRWLVEFGARLPAERPDDVTRRVAAALSEAASAQPALSNASAERAGDGVRLAMTVESENLGGAVTAALPVARQALGALPIAAMSAAEA